MSRSVLVLGRTGMLGQACRRRLEVMPDCAVEGTQRVDPKGPYYVDVSASSESLERVLASRTWDFVINAIGVVRSLVDLKDLESVRRTIRINAIVPHEVAAIAGRLGTRVIHVSTDAVFGPSSDAPYTEAIPTSPSEFYGNTKVLGECCADNVINLRCSIVGRDPHHGRGLVEWLLAIGPGGTANGFTDFIWSAATTEQVAELCVAILDPGVFDRLRQLSPVYHFAPNNPISKYEFLRTLAELSRPDVTVSPTPNPGGPMRRTLQTQFTDFRQLLPEPRPWKDVLAALVRAENPPSSHSSR